MRGSGIFGISRENGQLHPPGGVYFSTRTKSQSTQGDAGGKYFHPHGATSLAAVKQVSSSGGKGPAKDTDGHRSGSRSRNLAGAEGAVPAGSALLLSVGAFALGLAFQSQEAWAEMSSGRYSRDTYTALI